MIANLLVSGLITTSMAPAPVSVRPEPALVSQRLLDEVRTVSGVPGMGAAIWHGDRIVWTGSSGSRDVERGLPVDEKTIFRLASVSKLLTATAVAKLHEEGRLDVDAPVTSILPWLKNGWAPLSARQLAAHVAGLPHYQAQDEGRGRVRFADERAAVTLFRDRPLLGAPGKAYNYSSWGYTLLGALVESRSGMAFPTYVRQQVTPGLAITLDATGSGNPDASAAYEFVAGSARRAPPHDFSYSRGGAGFGGTPAAIASFGGNMLRNRVVSPRTFEWMLAPAKLADGGPVTADDYQVGLGWRTSLDEDGARTAHHNGITIGTRSALLLWRDEDMAVSLLSNALWTSSIDRTARMIAAPHRPLPKALLATPCPTSATRYNGSFAGQPVAGKASFALEGRVCTGTLEIGGALKAWLSRGPQPGAAALRLIGLDEVGGLARAGLITPFGIYDLRAQADGSFKVPFGGTREIAVRLSG